MKTARATWVITLLVAAVALTLWAQPRFRAAQRNAQCVQNLNQIWAAVSIYVTESKSDSFPPLSTTPGRLMFDSAAIYPKHLPETVCFVSPFHPDYSQLRKHNDNPPAFIDDASYWYPGYIFGNERSALAWVEEYKRLIPEGRLPANTNEVWPEYTDDIEARDKEYRARYDEAAAAIRADWIRLGRTGEPPGPARMPMGAGPLLHEECLYQGLKNGVERFLITDIGNPAGSMVAQAIIPILIERPDLHGDGGHVLFMDGHVEFVPFPGPFPMTEKFIDGLRSLDRVN